MRKRRQFCVPVYLESVKRLTPKLISGYTLGPYNSQPESGLKQASTCLKANILDIE